MPIIEMKVPEVVFYDGNYLNQKEVRRRLAISRSIKGRSKPTGVCKHCGRRMARNVLSRWHNDNCKEKVTL